ncbi:MAG TPA: hypothetical protein VHO47_04955 [Candidatus Babeliales bacterium]|nr:hypothetical protein [Candidatus Babeliales bacterium]
MIKQLTITMLIVLGSFNVLSMDHKKPVFAFSTEVISGNGVNLGAVGNIQKLATETIPQASSIIANHPKMLFHAYKITQMGVDIAKTTDKTKQGIGNLVDELNRQLTDQKIGTFSDAEKKVIMKFAVKPTPKQESIEKIQETRKITPVLFATNQDLAEHTLYRELMAEQGTDIAKSFDGIVSTPLYSTLPAQTTTTSYHQFNNSWYLALGRNPSAEFTATVRAMANTAQQGAPVYLFSSRPEIIDGLKNNQQEITPILFVDAKAMGDLIADKLQNFNQDMLD